MENQHESSLFSPRSKPVHLNNLGTSFSERFKRSRDLVDLDSAISTHEKAVNLTNDVNLNKPSHSTNLGNAFGSHFEHSGDLVDIDRAIDAHERAVNLIPDGHASKPKYSPEQPWQFILTPVQPIQEPG